MTIRILSLCVLALALVVAPAARAVTLVYQATLLGSNESPPSGSLGTGTATVTVDTDILSMRVEASFSGLGANVTIAHIHCCLVPAGPPNVGVATPVPTFPGFPAGVTSGTYDQTFDLTLASSFNPAFVTSAGGGDLATARTAFLNGLNDGATYFNIHTTQFQAGEIRGNLFLVPEPQSLALVGLALAALLRRARA